MKMTCLVTLMFAVSTFAADYHVAVTGDNANPGTRAKPFRTIQHAANRAKPGDVINVHEGVYRERIDPPRGGTSGKNRITYQAVPGDTVVITGSEPFKGWVKQTNNTWKLTLKNSRFGERNPFDELIYGSWYTPKGNRNHTGSVYLNGSRIREAFSLKEVMKPLHGGAQPRWYAEADGNGGPVVMNLEWVQPKGGARMVAMDASVENGDQAMCVQLKSRWPAAYLKDGSILHFDHVDFRSGSDQLSIQAATMAKGGVVEIRSGKKPDGELLGACTVTNTGDWANYRVFTTKLSKSLSGKQDLCLVIRAPRIKPDGVTTIWTQFPEGVDPNTDNVEISMHAELFYPSKVGVNYITVRGFTLENSAVNWAPPSANQPGLIGPRWAKGWIIENNTIRNSRCTGVAIGRSTFGHAHHYQKPPPRIYPEEDGGQTVEQLRDYFVNASWTKSEAGFHVIRNNHIYNCGQAGIVGCSGGAFSIIENNEIHDICVNEPFTGAEQAGIKLHFPIDTIIRNNHIYRCWRGLWLDWGSQGVLVTGNLFHDNNMKEDLFVEVCHGPILVANNVFLSEYSLNYGSQGIATVHNLITGRIKYAPDGPRRTSYTYKPHGTVSTGRSPNLGGDLQFYNNLLANGASLGGQGKNRHPVVKAGNVFVSGAKPGPSRVKYLMNVYSFKPSGGTDVMAVDSAKKSGTENQPCVLGGSNVAWISDSCWLTYGKVDFGNHSDQVEFRIAAADGPGKGGVIELRLDNPKGKLLGKSRVAPTGGWQSWKTVRATIPKTSGKKNVCLVFRDGSSKPFSPAKDLDKRSFDADVKLTRKTDGWYLDITMDPAWATQLSRQLVTTKALGKTVITKQAFTNPDGSPIKIDTDFLGKPRNRKSPFPGPFEQVEKGLMRMKVWPK